MNAVIDYTSPGPLTGVGGVDLSRWIRFPPIRRAFAEQFLTW
jgi:hypothetical protein